MCSIGADLEIDSTIYASDENVGMGCIMMITSCIALKAFRHSCETFLFF